MSTKLNGKFPTKGKDKTEANAGKPKAKTLNLYPLEEVIFWLF